MANRTRETYWLKQHGRNGARLTLTTQTTVYTHFTNSEVLKGIEIKEDKFLSETLVTHKNSNFKKVIKSFNSINE